MRKLLAVFKREYVQVVRKKSFLIFTILMPFFLLALVAVPSLLMVRGLGGRRVAVLDASGRLRAAFESAGKPAAAPAPAETSLRGRRRALRILWEYVPVSGDLSAARAPYFERLTSEEVPKERRLQGVLVIPAGVFAGSRERPAYYSRSGADWVMQERIERIVNQAVWRERLVAKGITAADADGILERLRLDAVQLSKSGEERKGGELNFLVAMLFAALLLIPMIAYGQEILRGIVQEKMDRVIEILVSSMTPMQLLSGKVLGLAAAGLTQVGIWLAMSGAAGLYLGGAAAASGVDLLRFVNLRIVPFFVIYYLLGYLTYSSVYAVGGAVSNSEKEAQQLVAPIMFILLIPWFLWGVILQNPDSTLAVVLSLLPIFTAITMFMRIVVSEPPLWQIGLSIVLSIFSVWGLFWMTAKIFRVGILSYGKRPTIPELWRWLKVA